MVYYLCTDFPPPSLDKPLSVDILPVIVCHHTLHGPWVHYDVLVIIILVKMNMVKIVTLNFPEDAAFHELLGSSSPGGIAVANKFDGDIVLMNPFTEKIGKVYQAAPPVVRLPPTSTMPKMDTIIEAWTRYCIDNKMRTDQIYYDFIHHIVWSSNPMSPGSTVIVVYGPYHNIAFCRPGDKSWIDTTLDCEYRYCYIQLLYSNKSKLFYFQRSNGTTFEGWDLQQPFPKMTFYTCMTFYYILLGYFTTYSKASVSSFTRA
ncbi:hypothetical protein FH972_003244 [Carpinus fangiana]|uniref:KIB1-4 beta-propeller domain-containing protein n=1 Tax=Carpinus fangiana TaxID=176857 RepID=A0A5N6QKR0_9ROSI|nr:hypothetical protein FH972_003244 [Carpinus fangiana]